jgi:hypothetical protein
LKRASQHLNISREADRGDAALSQPLPLPHTKNKSRSYFTVAFFRTHPEIMATAATMPGKPVEADETTELSKQYDTPMGLAHTTMQALKDRIKLHYDLASDYYLSLW